MKHLKVGRFENCDVSTAITEVSFLLDTVNKNLLSHVPWKQYKYHPRVHFAMAYGKDCIFLKYFVNEQFIKATHGASNTTVYQDSCVEFFISFDDEKTYYNFEFNCIGTMLIGYGATKSEREMISELLIRSIRYQSVIGNDQQDENVHWELTLAIPFKVFCYHKLYSLDGKKCGANFYKCGDNLPIPHFITWSGIDAPEPDFHLPEFFGALQFV